MSLFNKIKESIDLVEYAKTLYGEPKKNNGNFWFHSGKEDSTPSLVVYKDYLRNGYYDYSKNGGGTIIDMCMSYYNLTQGEAVKKLKEDYKITDEAVFIKPKVTKRDEILSNFESLRNSGVNNFVSQFLQNRGFSFDFIQNNFDIVDEVAKEFGIAENVWIGKNKDKTIYKNCVCFPCYSYDDGEVKTVGVKLRRVDNEKIGSVKSLALKGGKTGLIYTKEVFESEEIILCEGETDYIVLKILGFKNVIGNLGGVASCVEEIKKITKKANSIISFYDNDKAGKKANRDLQIKLNRQIKEIQYPQIEGGNKDINDLFKIGYTKQDFQELIDKACYSEDEIDDDYNDEDLIIEKKDGYYIEIMIKDNPIEIRLTNFLIKIEDIVLYGNDHGGDDEKKLILKLYNNKKEARGEFSSKQTTDSKSFNSKVRSLETSFSCYDIKLSHLEAIIRKIHKEIDIKNTIVVKNQGYIPEHNIWTFDNGIMSNQKFIPYNENNVCDIGNVKIKYSGQGKYIAKFQDDYFYDENIKNTIIENIRYMFNGVAGDLVLGFLFASLFVNNLKKELKPFPILFVSGKKGSGKTTAVDYALRILGLEVSAENFETSTEFIDQLDISEVSSLPLWRDEYKNNQKVKRKDGFIKSIFDRNGLSKGTVIGNSLGKNTYPVNATLLLSGEETPNDDAVFSRCAMVQVKQDRGSESFEKFENIKKRIDYYGSITREMLEKNDFIFLTGEYQKIFEETKIYLIKELQLEKRILNVYLPLIAGYFFFQKIILKNNFSENDKFDWYSDILQIIQEKMDEENNNDIINEFFGVLDTMYTLHDIAFQDDYIKISGNNVQLAYSALYSLFNEKQRRQGGREIPSKDLKKYMFSEYGVKESTMSVFGKTTRSLQFNTEKIPENLENIIQNYKNYLTSEGKSI